MRTFNSLRENLTYSLLADKSTDRPTAELLLRGNADIYIYIDLKKKLWEEGRYTRLASINIGAPLLPAPLADPSASCGPRSYAYAVTCYRNIVTRAKIGFSRYRPDRYDRVCVCVYVMCVYVYRRFTAPRRTPRA